MSVVVVWCSFLPNIFDIVFKSHRDDGIHGGGIAVVAGEGDGLNFAARKRHRFAGKNIRGLDDAPVARGRHREGIPLVALEKAGVAASADNAVRGIASRKTAGFI